jgi:hypothetical protein
MRWIADRIRAVLRRLTEQNRIASPIDLMTPREWADLPIHHPRQDQD